MLWQENGTARVGRGKRRDKEKKETGGKEGDYKDDRICVTWKPQPR
jgi:hypothetical protein